MNENAINTIDTNNTDTSMNIFMDKDAFARLDAFAENVLASKFFNKLSNKEEVISAIVLGQEIGIAPMTAISLGKRLNSDTIYSVLKGRAMGIPAIVAMDHIHNISTNNGEVSVVDVHILTGLLIKAGVTFTIIEDAAPLYKYIGTNKVRYNADYVLDNPSTFQIITQDTPQSDWDSTKIKVALETAPIGLRTKIKFTRKSTGQELTIKYTTQEAIDAGLLKGVSSLGEQVKGKENWNKHLTQMLLNRVLSKGARIIASDYAQGIYTDADIDTNGTIDFTPVEVIKNDDNTNSVVIEYNSDDSTMSESQK